MDVTPHYHTRSWIHTPMVVGNHRGVDDRTAEGVSGPLISTEATFHHARLHFVPVVSTTHNTLSSNYSPPVSKAATPILRSSNAGCRCETCNCLLPLLWRGGSGRRIECNTKHQKNNQGSQYGSCWSCKQVPLKQGGCGALTR